MATVVNLVLSDDQRWTDGAACAEEGAPYMFPNDHDYVGIQLAKETCNRCPIQPTCLESALDNREPAGVWGGLTVDERRNVLRRAVARRPAAVARMTGGE